jgi:hypothetical protein
MLEGGLTLCAFDFGSGYERSDGQLGQRYGRNQGLARQCRWVMKARQAHND